ncbi:MAG: hypothetical protein NC410_08980 [Oscillibacter sp.]|nr:hypothetical protein [Oscillibacter sp.]
MINIEKRHRRKWWKVIIDSDELLNKISLDSNYREHAMEEGGEKYILMEDDMDLFHKLLHSAMAELWLKIGRMSKYVPDGINYSEGVTIFRLEVTRNHDDNMIFSFEEFINDFLINTILKGWYLRNNINEEMLKCDQEAQAALSNVITVVHYRKRPVRRPIDPLF